MRRTINVANCVEYLRSIGAEVSDTQAQEWEIAERVHRYLRGLRGPVRECWDCWCRNGHTWTVIIDRRRRRRNDTSWSEVCQKCDARVSSMRLRWSEASDGTFRDYRPASERWRPLDEGVMAAD